MAHKKERILERIAFTIDEYMVHQEQNSLLAEEKRLLSSLVAVAIFDRITFQDVNTLSRQNFDLRVELKLREGRKREHPVSVASAFVARQLAMEVEGLEDESVFLLRWEPFKSITLIIAIVAILIIGVAAKLGMINFILKMAPNRPISFNIIVDQMIELPTFVIMTTMMLITLVTSKPLSQMFGPAGTFLFWLSTVVHNFSLTIGGCGIAIYRLICIQNLGFTLNIKWAERVMIKIMKLELAMVALMTLTVGSGAYLSNEAMAVTVAKGHSATMENIINPNEKEEQRLGSILISLGIMGANSSIIVEMVCYIIIYIQLYINDERIKASVGNDVVSSRRRRNVLSLSSQVISLCVELACGITGALIVGLGITDASVFMIISSLMSTVTSALHVLGSGEMRKYYFSALEFC